MNLQTESLWPTDLGEEAVVTPVVILREQAALLASKTKGIVEGHVSTSIGIDNNIRHSFELVAPALGGYRYELFRISHSVLPFPLEIISDSTLESFSTREIIHTSEQFVAWLKDKFASPHTKRVVNSLLAQSMQTERTA